MDVTADGPTTLDRALVEGVDLILLDIGLPNSTGSRYAAGSEPADTPCPC